MQKKSKATPKLRKPNPPHVLRTAKRAWRNEQRAKVKVLATKLLLEEFSLEEIPSHFTWTKVPDFTSKGKLVKKPIRLGCSDEGKVMEYNEWRAVEQYFDGRAAKLWS